MAREGRSAFFYGTLMAPQVLHRVIHGSMAADNAIYAAHNLRTRPAILHDYQRRCVKEADYPAITPSTGSSVRGTFVTGLTDADVWRLDIFEGSEYKRDNVKVKLLKAVGDDEGQGNVEGGEVEAETYVWKAGDENLEATEWDFAEFQRDKMRFWVGAEGEGEYAEVDGTVAAQEQYETEPVRDGTGGRGANGHISSALKEAQQNSSAI